MQLARILIIGIISICSAPSFADAYDLPQVVAVQNRAYSVSKEISVNAGILPLDAFNKSLIGGASYTYGWSPQWSWEVLNLAGAMNMDTSLKKDLVTNFSVQPKGILDHPTAMATSELLYSPNYGKLLFYNKHVVHTEISLGLSGGVIQYKSAGSIPIIGGGITSRFFRSASSSIKFDARVYYQMTNTQSSNLVLYFTLGYSIHLGMQDGSGS